MTLVGHTIGLPTPVQGYINLDKGMHITSSAYVAILDGVLYFNIVNVPDNPIGFLVQ